MVVICKVWVLYTQARTHYAKFGRDWPIGWNATMYFHYFVIISPSERTWPFIWTSLNSLHPRMLCAKFGWNWLMQCVWRRKLNFVNVFTLFCYYLPFVKSPLHKNAFSQVWLKSAHLFWRRRFLKFRQCIFAISLSSPLWKRRGSSLQFVQTWMPYTQRCIV